MIAKTRFRRCLPLLLLTALLILAARPAAAQEIGGRSDAAQDNAAERAPLHLGNRLAAGALSLALPGAGQLYNGQTVKARVYGVAELAVWLGYYVFETQADGYAEDYREYSNIYAGVSGDHTERYWRTIGRYMDSDAYNTGLLIEARATGETPNLIAPEDAWFWRSETHLSNYQSLRADTNRAKERRDFTVLFAIINRAVAVYDAVRNAGPREHMLEVAGFGVDLQQRYRRGNREALCVFSRTF